MKKILAMMLLALLVVFTGCDDGSSDSYDEASAEDQAIAENVTGIAYSAASTAAATALDSLEGVESGTSRTTYTITAMDVPGYTGVSVYGSISGSETSWTASLTVAFDNYTYDGTTLDGSITYYMEGSGEDASLASIGGDLVVTYEGQDYDMAFYIEIEFSGDSATITGYAEIEGDRAYMEATI